MSIQSETQHTSKQTQKSLSKPVQQTLMGAELQVVQEPWGVFLQRAFDDRVSISPSDTARIQRTIGNQSAERLFSQMKDSQIQIDNSSLETPNLSLQRLLDARTIQAKPNSQRPDSISGGEISSNLESAISTARGSGQPLEAGLQESMGQRWERHSQISLAVSEGRSATQRTIADSVLSDRCRYIVTRPGRAWVPQSVPY